MPDTLKKPKVLLSDPAVLRKIKYIQFRKQMIPLIIVIALMITNIFWTQPFMLYLTLASFGWFLFEKMIYRTKNKILAPGAGAFVSPIDGKVVSIRRGEEITTVTLHKATFDVVELRLPFPNLQSEVNGIWDFETELGQVNVKIKSDKVHYYDFMNLPGSVIGAIFGKAKVIINMPSTIKLLVTENQNLFGGETELFTFAKEADADAEPRSILVEEPIDDLT